MRPFILLFLLSVTTLTVNAQKTDSTTISFNKRTYNFGEIEQNSDGTCEFVFKNTGKIPIIISNVKSSCGCTVPQKPKKSILPRKKGKIKVKYDTRRIGKFKKTIRVYSNATPSVIVLTITGMVKPK